MFAPERKEVLDYSLIFLGAYVDTPFHDDSWTLLRYDKIKCGFAFVFDDLFHGRIDSGSDQAAEGFRQFRFNKKSHIV